MKNKLTILTILALLCSLALTSCGDAKLAKQMDGAWKGSYTVSYDDGAKEEVQKKIIFRYDEDNATEDGGSFVEELYGKMNNIDLEMIDGTMSYRYRSRITGKWEVLLGDLYLTYDIGSLEVKVGKDDIDMKLNRLTDQLNMFNYTLGTLSDPIKEIAQESQKDIYRELFHQYQESNDPESCYGNIEVSENELRFDTDDLGRMTFRRLR